MSEPSSAHVIPPAIRAEDFISTYANALRFEPTVYDLKIIFGQTDVSQGNERVEQRAAATIPWALAKLAIYFLEVNIRIHEAQHGKVHVPVNQIPAEPIPPADEMKDNQAIRDAFKLVQQVHADFLASL
ncbi:MAG: hypothetical protein ACJ74Z_06610 [Bryobacteraceae bacterium]|jgi:hypothetical protein